MVLNCELEIDAGTRLTTTTSLRVLMVSFVVGFITDGGVLGLCSGFVRDSFGMQSYNIRNWQLGGCMVLYAILWITGGQGKDSSETR